MSKGGRFDSRRFIPIVPRRQQFAFSVSLPAASRFLRPHSSEQTSLHRHPSIDIAREQHSTSGRSLQCSLSLSLSVSLSTIFLPILFIPLFFYLVIDIESENAK